MAETPLLVMDEKFSVTAETVHAHLAAIPMSVVGGLLPKGPESHLLVFPLRADPGSSLRQKGTNV